MTEYLITASDDTGATVSGLVHATDPDTAIDTFRAANADLDYLRAYPRPVKANGSPAAPAEIRQMVRTYRAETTFEETRSNIRASWAAMGIPNQFAAMLRAAALEQATQPATV